MVISSTLLALNLKLNYEEVMAADLCAICVVQANSIDGVLSEIDQELRSKKLGKALPIVKDAEESSFAIIFESLDTALRTLKRLLWESGYLLSSKIVLVKPVIKILKEYGDGM